MFEALVSTLLIGLKLWNSQESHKYVDRVVELKKRHYEEINKPDETRDDAVIDNLEFELRILATAFSASAGKQNS